jgi:hypothetical protein
MIAPFRTGFDILPSLKVLGFWLQTVVADGSVLHHLSTLVRYPDQGDTANSISRFVRLLEWLRVVTLREPSSNQVSGCAGIALGRGGHGEAQVTGFGGGENSPHPDVPPDPTEFHRHRFFDGKHGRRPHDALAVFDHVLRVSPSAIQSVDAGHTASYAQPAPFCTSRAMSTDPR